MSHHGMETQRRIVAMLRSDTALASPSLPSPGSLLFPAWSPQVNAFDQRVYEVNVELPEDPDVREALPRILVDVRPETSDREQWGTGIHEGPVIVEFRIITPKEQSQLCDEIASAVGSLIASTPLSNARIIAAELVPEGRMSKGRISAFNGAWEIVERYRSANVGVLV